MPTRRPPLAIVGATASGKSSLAHAIARVDPTWEIVAVDSMQVYRGMDIGTASPTAKEQAEVRYHLVSVADPADDYDLATFQAAARAAIADIERRDHRALLVGGTALYLRSIIDDLRLPGQYPDARTEIEAEPDTESLHARLTVLDPVAAARMEPSNRRRVVRALEVTIGSGQPFSSFGPGLSTHPPSDIRQLGLDWPLDVLDQRIARRYDDQLAAGFVDEVAALLDADRPWSRTAAQALGYREIAEHLAGARTLDDAITDAVTRTRRFARRQRKWFRRDPRIEWLPGDLPDLVDRTAAWIGSRPAAD